MSPAYGKGVREHLGNATLVYDHYHMVSTVVAGPGEDPLVVAQESRALDGARGPALGATTRQAVGNELGLCDAAAIATSLCLADGRGGAGEILSMVRVGACGSRRAGQRAAGADA